MTKKILHIDSSIKGDDSDSRQLSKAFIDMWQAEHWDDEVIVRDIVSTPLPHIDGTLLAGLFSPAESHTEATKAALARVDELIEEFMASDIVVIGAPMYNFGIPSTLKAWLDHIVQAGRTFKYTENGPVGLAKGKCVFILSTRGGVYEESPLDHQVAYLKTVLGFLGIEDIRVVQAEGLNMSPEKREHSLAAAEDDIQRALSGRQAAACA